MDIRIGDMPRVKNDLKGGGNTPDRQMPRRDRRKNQQDRRKGVRDGVIVRLSFKNDRRKNPDRRRKAGTYSPTGR